MHPSGVQSPLLDEKEAGAYLRLAVATLRRWRWAGQGPSFVKIGGRVRYDIRELDRYIESAVRQSTCDRRDEA